MKILYDRAFVCMEVTVHGLEGLVPAPRLVETKQGRVYRYEERLAKQAIVQKLARLVSTLRAARLLLDRGFVQDVGTLERVLDEILQDVHFLVVGLESPTKLHRQFLSYFYEEEFDAETARESTQKRGMVSRQRIRAHFGRSISDIPASGFNPSDLTEDLRSVDKGNSGYVHGASPHLMEMYFGDPPEFQMNGMLGTSREREHRVQFWNYVYRAICAFALVVRAFGDPSGSARIVAFAVRFEQSKPGAA